MLTNLNYFFLCLTLVFSWSCEQKEQIQVKSELSLVNDSLPPDDIWGIHFNPFSFHTDEPLSEEEQNMPNSELDLYMDLVAELSVTWVRISLEWSKVENSSGEFVWDKYDYCIKGLKERGVKTFLSVHGGHPLHTEKRSPATDAELEKWHVFLEKATKRYAEAVKYWEIWNEPNTKWFWKPKSNAAAYTRIMKESAQVIKKNVEGSFVLGGSFARVDAHFADSLGQLGGLDAIDIFTFHPYSEQPETLLKKNSVQVVMPNLYMRKMNTAEELRQVLHKYNPQIEVWQGECGYASAARGLGWNGPGPFNETIQSKWILRRIGVDRLANLEKTIIFTFKDFQNNSKTKKNSKGLVTLENKRKPSFHVFKNFISLFRGGEWVLDDSSLTFEAIKDEGDFSGLTEKDIIQVSYRTEDEIKTLIWFNTVMQTKVKPAKVEFKSQQVFSEVKAIDLINPECQVIEKVDQNRLNTMISDYPIILVRKL